MKRWLCLMAALLLGGCNAQQPSSLPPTAPEAPQTVADAPEAETLPPSTAAATQPKNRGMEDTVRDYIEQQYVAYATLQNMDFSALVDTAQPANRNALTWLRILIQRRKLLKEENLCYVEAERFPYTITFIPEEELADQRMPFWADRGPPQEGERYLHFVVTGEPGRAYPPMLALNAQHTVRLRKSGGVWKITFHYYPGSVRRFRGSAELRIPDETEMLAQLREEFSAAPPPRAQSAPANAARYAGDRAARYAERFISTPNPEFYDIGDWMGNCANFISQCVWSGFGGELDDAARDEMTPEWYAGGGGGSPAWENVDYFWQYATQGGALYGQPMPNAAALAPGDIIQIRTGAGRGGDEEDFNHSLLVVDADTLRLAQNSPDCFVYYADLANVESRFLRPAWLAG